MLSLPSLVVRFLQHSSQEKYQIDISIQAVQQNYHKYKRKTEESNKNKLVKQEGELHKNHFSNEEEEKLDIRHRSIRIKIQIK
ncbi:hypothetical protein CXF65_00355 [Psychrobacter sp. Sarcosine-3u-12]|nr:hypothetical protein CXF65_00355 [Psychrobacter sp. Sarcosine-3u-12]